MPHTLHLAVALEGAGWHPAAWREPSSRPSELFSAGYWLDLVSEAERGLIDFVTFEDSFGLQANGFASSSGRTDQVQGRLDAVLIAARVAPLTRHIGLMPTAVVTHTEPFHLSKAIATLDYVSKGRAGVRVQISARGDDAKHFGRRELPELTAADLAVAGAVRAEVQEAVSDLFAEASEYVEVMRRLWDSWEDDAEIRDVATGRFIDREKIHYIDFQGPHFSVKGPSIVPRPPQGQPLVAALAHSAPASLDVPYRFAATTADIVFVTPVDESDARRIVDQLGAFRPDIGTDPLQIFADLVVFLDTESESGVDRRARLDALTGDPYASDAHIFTGSATELADLLTRWQEAGITGFRLRPGCLPDDLTAITNSLIPALQSRDVFRRSYESDTLRGLLGLTRPANRYATGTRISEPETTARQGVSA